MAIASVDLGQYQQTPTQLYKQAKKIVPTFLESFYPSLFIRKPYQMSIHPKILWFVFLIFCFRGAVNRQKIIELQTGIEWVVGGISDRMT